jgi:hypothetical protein
MRLRLKASVNRISSSDLQQALKALKSELVVAAQKVYDEWDASDPEMGDALVGSGGICHLIVDEWMDVVQKHIPNVACQAFSHSDQVHVSLTVWLSDPNDDSKPLVDEEVGEVETVDIDVNPYNYETGAGYTWTKIPGVEFSESWLSFYRQWITPADLTAEW